MAILIKIENLKWFIFLNNRETCQLTETVNGIFVLLSINLMNYAVFEDMQ